MLQRLGRRAPPVDAGAGPVQRLRRHAQGEHVPVHPHDRHARTGHAPSRSRFAPRKWIEIAREGHRRALASIRERKGTKPTAKSTSSCGGCGRCTNGCRTPTRPTNCSTASARRADARRSIVFTPKGEVKELPRGRYPAGLRLSRPLRHRPPLHRRARQRPDRAARYNLQTGDVVEILTSKNQTPHLGWLDIVVTGRRGRASASGCASWADWSRGTESPSRRAADVVPASAENGRPARWMTPRGRS